MVMTPPHLRHALVAGLEPARSWDNGEASDYWNERQECCATC